MWLWQILQYFLGVIPLKYINKVQHVNIFLQIKTRLENEQYLRDHPEVDCLIAGFLGYVTTKYVLSSLQKLYWSMACKADIKTMFFFGFYTSF